MPHFGPFAVALAGQRFGEDTRFLHREEPRTSMTLRRRAQR